MLKKFIEKIFQREKKKLGSLRFIFTTDKELLKINREFLDHDYLTDIITFDLSTTVSIEGEVYISINRVKDNAKALHQPFYLELHRVIFHGCLHLCGYRDDTSFHVKKIREKEDFYLQKYF